MHLSLLIVQEYDPETTFAPISPKDEDLPYDPEQDE